MKNERHEPSRLVARQTIYMSCTPADCERDGVGVSLVTLADEKSGEIFPAFLSLHDTRQLACALMISLASSDDDFAAKVLEERFSADDDGNYRWPKPDDSL